MIVLASADAAVLERWSQALPQAQAALRRVATLAELEGLLAGRQPDVVVLDLRLPELRRTAGVPALLRFSRTTHVLAMAEVPEDDEALAVLRAGAHGYANLYMDPRLLARAVEVLSAGEAWVSRQVVDRLLALVSATHTTAGATASDAADVPALAPLSARERQIARLIGNGASNKDIARALEITERTVKAHLSAVFDKVGVRDRLQLALLVNGRPTVSAVKKVH